MDETKKLTTDEKKSFMKEWSKTLDLPAQNRQAKFIIQLLILIAESQGTESVTLEYLKGLDVDKLMDRFTGLI